MSTPSKEKLTILDKYVGFVKKKNAHPSRADMQKLGVSRDKIRHHFGSHLSFKKQARLHEPKAFENIVDESLFTAKNFKKLKEKAGKYNVYFITTAVTGCEAHEGFLESIATFCKQRNACLLTLTATDPASNAGFLVHPSIPKEGIVFGDLALNDNLYLSSIKLSAKHIDPITGLSRIGQRNGSFIYASPKQRLKMTSTSNRQHNHAIMTTGAVTKPDYSTERYMSERTGYIATEDHIIGGIIVEIVDDRKFHFRQVQADRRGHFVDLGTFYRGTKIESLQPEALVLGDWHSGETDPDAAHHFVFGPSSVRAVTKPRKIVIHDGFNGKSINHHEEKNRVLRAQLSKSNHLSLQDELAGYCADLNKLSSYDHIDEVIIVKSNHDEFLERYLAEAKYVDEPHNHLIGLKLAAEMVEGRNPLESGIDWLGLKNKDKFVWLDRDEDYKIANVEVGAHGDKGSNGARGSLRAMESAYGQSVSGHSHTAEILRGAWQVGTCSLLNLSYNKGPSSWSHTSCLIYGNGMRQLISVIDGDWQLK